MDKVRLLTLLDSYIDRLNKEYRQYIKGLSKHGKPLSYGSASYYRTQCKHKLALVKVMRDLVLGELSADSEETLHDFIEWR